MRPARRPYNGGVKAVWLNRILLVLAWAGVFVAGMLSLQHAMKLVLPCGPSGGCDLVSQHPSSRWFGIPVAYFGLVGYLILAVLAQLRAFFGLGRSQRLIALGFFVSGFGTLASAYLTYVSLFQIRATCEWCLTSAGLMTALFLGHAVLGQLSGDEIGPTRRDGAVGLACFVLAVGGIGIVAARLDRASEGFLRDLGQSTTPEEIVLDRAHFKGPSDAPITIVEYADFYCGACRVTFPQFMDLYRSANGRIRVAYQHFPLYNLRGHENSVTAAFLAEYAATQGKFWEYVEAVYAANPEDIQNEEQLLTILGRVGVDLDRAIPVLNERSDEFADRVEKQRSTAIRLGLQGTPEYIVFATGTEPKAGRFQDVLALLQQEPYASLLRGDEPAR